MEEYIRKRRGRIYPEKAGKIVPSNDSRRRRGKPAEKTVELATLKTNGVK